MDRLDHLKKFYMENIPGAKMEGHYLKAPTLKFKRGHNAEQCWFWPGIVAGVKIAAWLGVTKWFLLVLDNLLRRHASSIASGRGVRADNSGGVPCL